MEHLKYYLNETGPKSDKKMQLLFGISGIIYITIGTINNLIPFSDSNILFIILGMISLGYALIYRKVIKRCFISLGDNGIKSNIVNKCGTFPKYEKITEPLGGELNNDIQKKFLRRIE